MTEFTVTQRLEVKHCPSCHMAYAAPAEFFARLFELHNRGEQPNWHCPAGHSIIFTGETEIDKVRRERDRLKQEMTRVEDERRAEERKRKDAEGEIKRQAKRSAAGVCSCCHRTFKQLAAHMRSKHPDQLGPPAGRQLSGLATAAAMTPEQRRERGQKGAAARWGH